MNIPEFEVGDIVTVVDEPYWDCPFEWVNEMSEYLSMQATITDKRWSNDYDTFDYHIDIDYLRHHWCGNCFVPAVEAPDFEAADSADISSLLGF